MARFFPGEQPALFNRLLNFPVPPANANSDQAGQRPVPRGGADEVALNPARQNAVAGPWGRHEIS